MEAASTLTPAAMPQHMQALAHANEVRLARAALKRSVASGEVDAADIVRECPWQVETMTVGELLAHAHASRVRVYLDPECRLRADVPEDAPTEADALLDELAARAQDVVAHLRAQEAPQATAPPAPRRPVPPALVRQVAARLRAGRAVRLETALGDLILAPTLDAARWAEGRCPWAAVLLPYEGRHLLDCEGREEVVLLLAVKRHLGARLLPERAAEVVAAS